MNSTAKRGLQMLFVVHALLCAATAFAHARLESQDPRAGGTLTEPPHVVRLHFSDALKAEGSHLWIENSSGDRVAEADALPTDGILEMVCTFPMKMRSGRFHVYWRAASTDGHYTQGDYWFTIQSADGR